MKKKECITAVLSLLLICTCFTGCSSEEPNSDIDNQTPVTEAQEEDVYIEGRTQIHYTARDLSGEYDDGVEVELGESYTIKAEGTYILSGTLADGQIIVDTDDQAKVQIVLNGVNLNCENGPAIYVKSADKVFLTLADESENHVVDGSDYTSTYINEDEPWGAIFSKDDLTINGTGVLNVTGKYLHGIVSKDSLKITGGVINVNAVEDGMHGKDEICIHDGNIAIFAKEDGLKSNNDTDDDRGNISIDGGSVSINGTASQGIDAYHVAQILGGTVNIDSENEGIQGEHIFIENGELNIDAVDDCLNAKDSLIEDTEVNHENALLEIAGGNLVLSTSAGDGLDSNGSILVSGGKTIVHGSSGGVEVSMDYNGTGTITGGVVLATGSNGMAQNFDQSSSQCSLMYNCSGNTGAEILLLHNDEEIVSFKSKHSFSSIIISSPEMKHGESYTLSVDGSKTTVELTETITSYGGMNMGGPGGHGGMPDEHGGHGGHGGMSGM